MSTYIEGGGGGVMAVICGALVLVCLASIPMMQNDTQKRKEATPCSSYKESKLSDIPAKCITPEGGYKP